MAIFISGYVLSIKMSNSSSLSMYGITSLITGAISQRVYNWNLWGTCLCFNSNSDDATRNKLANVTSADLLSQVQNRVLIVTSFFKQERTECLQDFDFVRWILPTIGQEYFNHGACLKCRIDFIWCPAIETPISLWNPTLSRHLSC